MERAASLILFEGLSFGEKIKIVDRSLIWTKFQIFSKEQ